MEGWTMEEVDRALLGSSAEEARWDHAQSQGQGRLAPPASLHSSPGAAHPTLFTQSPSSLCPRSQLTGKCHLRARGRAGLAAAATLLGRKVRLQGRRWLAPAPAQGLRCVTARAR